MYHTLKSREQRIPEMPAKEEEGARDNLQQETGPPEREPVSQCLRGSENPASLMSTTTRSECSS